MTKWKKMFDVGVRVCQALMIVLFFSFAFCGCSVTLSVEKADMSADVDERSGRVTLDGSVEGLESAGDVKDVGILDIINSM